MTKAWAVSLLAVVLLACAQWAFAVPNAHSDGVWDQSVAAAAPALDAEEADAHVDVALLQEAEVDAEAEAEGADDEAAEAGADADAQGEDEAEGEAEDSEATDAEADADAEADDAADAYDAGAIVRFAQAEAESEAELEAEVEAEMAAEAEANAELLTRTALRAAQHGLTEAATGTFAEATRWMGWDKADAAHSQLTKAALQTLTEVDGDSVARVFDERALTAGVQWNDQPCGSDKHPADEPLERDAFHREYAYHGAHSALVHNVHFGCLQHFRSQCPSVQRPDLQNEYGDDRYVFSNGEVRDIIIGQLRYWWRLAVDQQQQSGGPTKRAPQKQQKSGKHAAADAAKPAPMPAPLTASHDANFALGHILGTVQDAWTQSHVLRSVEDAPSPAGSEIDAEDKGHALAEQCGRVHYFQGGDSQEGNKNKATESAQASAMFYTCSQYYSYLVLRAFLKCATSGADANDQSRWCTFETAVKPFLEESVYTIAGDHELKPAGGSVERYASPRIERLGYNKVQYDVPGVGPVQVYEPTSTKLWRGIGADDLTVSLCHSVVGKVRNFNGVTFRNERFSDFQAVARGQRQLQQVTCGVDNRKHVVSGPFYVVDRAGVCETFGWRLSSGCSSHRSCRPAKGSNGCKGRCLCGVKGNCRCVRRFDAAKEQCKPGIKEMS